MPKLATPDTQLKPTKPKTERVPSNFDLAGFLLAGMYELQSDGIFTQLLSQDFELPEKLIFVPYSQIRADGQLSYPNVSNIPLERTIIHFYLDDWRFESAWRSHTQTIQRLRQFHAVIAPDFSVHYNAQLPPNLFNVYRNRLITRHWQEYGLKVIYCLSWGLEDTFDYCFEGIPQHSILSIKSCSQYIYKEIQDAWMAGFIQLCEKLQPKQILCCNNLLPQAFEYIKQRNYDINVIEFPNFWEAKRQKQLTS
jgi:hypothetical protein